jgi:hypothetical protein
MAGPVTVRCRYDSHPDIPLVTDWLPLLWTTGWAVSTLVGVVLVLNTARRFVSRDHRAAQVASI